MKANEALIAWTPTTWADIKPGTAGKVEVGPLIREGMKDWTNPYAYTGRYHLD